MLDPREHDWLTTSEVARRLGCHRNTARTMAKQGVFPNAIRLKRDIRVPVCDVEAYLEQHRIRSAEDQ